MAHLWDRGMLFAALCAGSFAGCIDGGETDGDGDELVAYTVVVRTHAPPAMIAFRDVAHPQWQSLPVEKVNIFELTVRGTYEVAIVCEAFGERPFVSTSVYGRTPEDEEGIEVKCVERVRPYDLTAEVATGGGLAFEGYSVGVTSGPWSFEEEVPAGSYDLVLRSGDFRGGYERIGIRRGVAITGDTDLGLIDFTQEPMHSLVPAEFFAANLLPQETPSYQLRLETGTTTASTSDFGSWSVKLAPDSALLSTDRQTLQLSAVTPRDANGQTRSRSISRTVRAGAPTQVTLPDGMGPMTLQSTLHSVTVKWEPPPAYDRVLLSNSSLGNGVVPGRSHQLSLSREYLRVSRDPSITLDVREIPGFKAEWLHAPALDRLISFSVSRHTEDEIESSLVGELVSSVRPALSTGGL